MTPEDRPDSGATSTAEEPQLVRATERAKGEWLHRPVIQGFLALAVYLVVFVVGYALPLLRHPGLPQVGQATTDPNFYIWSWRWWPYAISHGLNPLYSRQIGAPAGYDLAWATTVPAAATLLAPLTLAVGPIASFNLTLLLSAPVCGWAAFVAARRLTGRFWPALLGGAVYGFSSYEVSHTFAGQANLIFNMLLPIMVYLALLWRDGKLGRRAFVALMSVAMALQFYLFIEAFIEMTMVWAAGLVIGIAVAPAPSRRTVARLAGLVTAAYAGAIVLALPYLIYALPRLPAGLTRRSPKYSLDLASLIVPRPNRLFGLTSLTHYATSLLGFSSSAYVGIPLLVVVYLLAVRTWQSRLTRLLVILFGLVLLLCMGPWVVIGTRQVATLPWAGLWSLPVLRSAEPVRFMLLGYLVLAIILAVWLATPAKNRILLAAQWALGVVAVGAILANLLTASSVINPSVPATAAARPVNALPAFLTTGMYRHYLQPGETVVVVSERGNAGLLFQADTDFYLRIAGGFINESLSTPTGIPGPVTALMRPTPARERQFRTYVRRAGVGAILVEQAWAAPWMHVFSQMGLHGTAAGGVVVYRT